MYPPSPSLSITGFDPAADLQEAEEPGDLVDEASPGLDRHHTPLAGGAACLICGETQKTDSGCALRALHGFGRGDILGHSDAHGQTQDLFPELSRQGHRHALVAPVQFLSDHLEVLYDIDVAARRQAEEAGIALSRIEMPNTMPELIEALAVVVQRELDEAQPHLP